MFLVKLANIAHLC